jgi:hypothetical protein
MASFGVGMAFFGLFKSKSERGQEALATEAKLTRAYDMGRRTSATVTQLIDTFYDEKVLPVCKNVADACNNDFERHHHDETTDDAMALCVNFGAQLKDLKQNAVDGVWDALGDWKYQLIEIGIKDDFDRYIAAKFDPVFEILDKNAREQMAYCAARISGHITDEMHAMTPDELKDFVARRDAGTSRR